MLERNLSNGQLDKQIIKIIIYYPNLDLSDPDHNSRWRQQTSQLGAQIVTSADAGGRRTDRLLKPSSSSSTH